MTVELLGQPSNGTAVVVNDVEVLFTPHDERLCSVGTFTYRLLTPCGESNTALVIVTHQPLEAILANDDTNIILSDGTCLVNN